SATRPSSTCCAAWGRSPGPIGPAGSAQLAVLAAAAVVAAAGLLIALAGFLAGAAQAHARHRLAPRLGDRRGAFLAARAAGTLRQLAARALDPVLHGRVDLILHRAVARPARGHRILRSFRKSGTRSVLPHRVFRSRRAS